MRRRIARLAVLVATIAVALFAVPLAVAVAAYLLADERAELARAADVAAITAGAQLGVGNPVTTLGGPPQVALALYDAAGNRLLGSGPPRADEVVRAAAVAPPAGAPPVDGTVGDELVVAVPVDHDSGPALTVRAATSRWDIYTRVGLVGLGMILLAVTAAAVAWWLARRLAQGLARPLEELSLAARRLGRGDFSARGPVSGVAEIDGVSAALADTATRLDAALARERAFSADASHQLRTPLAGLRLGLEAALEDPGSDPRAALSAAVAATDRLEEIVEDLLALARDTHHTGETLDLDAVLTAAGEAWRPGLARHGRRLTLCRDTDPPVTTASPRAVRQILDVLLDNAVVHGAGEVVLTARDASGALALVVRDEGAGVVDPGALFTRRAPGSPGHGIGLALARSLAEAEGGRLQASADRPATFTLLLPPAG